MITPYSGNVLQLWSNWWSNTPSNVYPGIDVNGNIVGDFPGTIPPEPLATFLTGMAPAATPYNGVFYGVGISGQVYYWPEGNGYGPYILAGNVGFPGVITGIPAQNITTPLQYTSAPAPAGAMVSPVVVGARGKAAMQVGQDPNTYFTYWAPLVLKPFPGEDDLVAVYA